MTVLQLSRGILPFSLCFLAFACGSDGDGSAQPDSDAGLDGSGAVVCGDGRLATTEACEGFDLRGRTCLDEGFESGVLVCSATCTLDTTRCVQCGDGVVGGSEVCDGSVDATLTCATIRGEGATGTLACADDCTAILDDACIDPPVDVPFAPCAETGTPCAEGLVCAPTELGDLCVPPCEGATDCPSTEWCATVAPDISTCLPKAGEGQTCGGEAPCLDALDCTPAFLDVATTVSVCARRCDACEADELCVEVPSGILELASDASCNPDVVTACAEGFTCQDTDPGEASTFRCARPYAVCDVPQALYAFGAEGPSDAQVCDLTGPTAGGRFCGLPARPNGATALCYPIFGEGESLGACIGLCDDGSLEGFGDADCGDGWTCGSPAGAALFYPQPGGPVACTEADTSACAPGYPSCLDLGEGPTCVRPARICVPAEGSP